MSESTGPHSINNITKGFYINSAGKSLPGCITKIANPDKDGNGEVGFLSFPPFHGFTIRIERVDFDGRTARLYGLPQRPWQHFRSDRR